MEKGFVALVGAGPGSKNLLTLRGKALIEKADVVAYDNLVGEEILSLIPTKAKKIYVGKQSNNHAVKQDRINEILLEEALLGNFVVRLKGGDPFVFGRGGEELELLVENNVPFEVVPGITSAISVPCFGGIPVTHRDFCHSLHIITGHKRENAPLAIDFEALVRTKGTLIFLMGVSSLKDIAKGLINGGMDKDMPAAVIENGTRPNQRKIVATLETLYEKAVESNIKPPSIIIVGKVCQMSDTYNWFEKKPLFGKKIIVTRPTETEGTLSHKLKDLGAQVMDFPCIEIKEIENPMLNENINNINDFDVIGFTSKNGVDIFFNSLKKKGLDSRIFGNKKVAVIGKQTADALLKYGIIADIMPQVYDGKHMGEAIIKSGCKKVLLFRAKNGNEEINQVIEKANISLVDIPIYETSFIKGDVEINENTIVTFTSASTVEGFAQNVSEFSKVFGVCIGKQTAKKASEYGINHIVAEKATIDSMIEAILEV